MADSWSHEEVEATVSSYFEMLACELRGEAYTKAEYRRALLPLLDSRTEGAIERKHMNISAVLIGLGFPYINGYKPYSNYQQLLFDVVESRLNASKELEAIVEADTNAVAAIPEVDDILASLVDVPTLPKKARRAYDVDVVADSGSGKARRVDYVRREAENISLGTAGEEFVVEFEKVRLIACGKEHLAAQVEHVAKTQGDGLGFDVSSFDDSGRKRFIEVKTTKYGAHTPFFVTANEVRVSERNADQYHLYRLFEFRSSPRMFQVAGSFRTRFSLQPTQYSARPA